MVIRDDHGSSSPPFSATRPTHKQYIFFTACRNYCQEHVQKATLKELDDYNNIIWSVRDHEQAWHGFKFIRFLVNSYMLMSVYFDRMLLARIPEHSLFLFDVTSSLFKHIML